MTGRHGRSSLVFDELTGVVTNLAARSAKPPWTLLDSSINALIRVMVLLLIAFLVDRVAAQTRALTREVQVLRGLLPICSFCKKIRNEDNTWERMEWYITRHSEAQFSHGVCPECAREHYGEFLNA